MPILVTGTTSSTTQAPRRTPPPTPAPPARWAWTPPGGTVARDLSRGTPKLRPGGVTGHLSPPVQLRESQPPSIPGGVYRGHRYAPRDIGLGLGLYVSTAERWRAETRSLVADFDTTSGDGVLTARYFDGEERSLLARYVTGLEHPSDGDPGATFDGTFAVSLRAYDPWWYGPVQRRTFQPAVSGGFPWPPIVVQSTELIGSGSVVTNPGDVEAYPVWTLSGPLSEVTATAESGASWTVTKTLGPGEVVTVDTDPRAPAFQRVTDFSGSNLWGIATPDYPDLWPLPAGDSTVTVAVSGASSATRIHMDFNPRYRTA